jgi:hypothetical protein
MTVFQSHTESARTLPERLRSLFDRIATALLIVHRAIVAARLRRLPRDLMFGDPGGDNADFPRPPLILGDKWDF